MSPMGLLEALKGDRVVLKEAPSVFRSSKTTFQQNFIFEVLRCDISFDVEKRYG